MLRRLAASRLHAAAAVRCVSSGSVDIKVPLNFWAGKRQTSLEKRNREKVYEPATGEPHTRHVAYIDWLVSYLDFDHCCVNWLVTSLLWAQYRQNTLLYMEIHVVSHCHFLVQPVMAPEPVASPNCANFLFCTSPVYFPAVTMTCFTVQGECCAIWSLVMLWR